MDDPHPHPPPRPDPNDSLERIYADVDARAAALARRHGPRLRCAEGCSSCCVDELAVFAVEADRIRRRHPDLLRDATPAPPGVCAFLDRRGSCRIYPDRPYVCRTQGLPLRWIDQPDPDPDHLAVVEYRDICPLNDQPGDEPLEALPADDCWTLGPIEQRLAALQAARPPGGPVRVPLRDLFRSNPDTDPSPRS